MIFGQVTLEIETTVKKPNGAEKNVIKYVTFSAEKKRITQNRYDEFSMRGLSQVVRYEVNLMGEYEDSIFEFFTNEKGKRFKTTMFERNPKNNKMIIEGVVANGI